MMGEALGRSLNVPAIRVAERVGAEALLARLRALGLSTLTRSAAYYGLGLTLGNGEVTLLDLAGAYAALARGGLTCRPKLVEKTDMDDFDRSELFNKFNILRDFDRTASSEPRRVFSEQVAFLVTDVLADESLRVTAFGPANSLLLDFPIAVKTGTSANWRDTWAVGYTARYTVAVWAGDFGGRSMNHLAGATGAGPLFHQIATRVHAWDGVRGGARRCPAGGHPHGGRSCTDPGQWPAAPDTVAAVSVCPLSGLRPGPSCPHRRVVHVPRDRQPDGTCDWHREIAIDARTELRAGPLCPDPHVDRRVFEVLPPAYASWSAGAGREAPPAVYSPLCPAAGPIPGSIAITRPRAGDVFVIEPGYDRATQSLRLVAEAEAGVQRVTWAVDGRVVARPGWPYVAEWPLAPGYHTVRATAPGQRGHELRIEVR
jgi:penicillin-binding protein 1C